MSNHEQQALRQAQGERVSRLKLVAATSIITTVFNEQTLIFAKPQMEPIQIFSLERHSGPYEKWPSRTRLLIHEKPSQVFVTGYQLLQQFKIDDGYLLITDYDCPFEEATSFILLSSDMKILSYKVLFVPYGSFNFENIQWLDDVNAHVTFWENDVWHLNIRKFGIPYIRPRLQIKRLIQTPTTGNRSG